MTTSQPSVPNKEQLTLLSEDFLAKTSALQASKPVSKKAQGLVSFTSSCESFAWYDPSSLSWKTWQRSLVTDWTPFSESWPRQGMTVSGHAYRLVLWEPAINEIGGGLLPTPSATDWKGRSGSGHIKRHGYKRTSDALIPLGKAMHLNPSFVEEMMGFPIGWTDLKH
jgi:hypothetical protein